MSSLGPMAVSRFTLHPHAARNGEVQAGVERYLRLLSP